jgi:uncharacterized protein YutE (UPF0331/DUF86 family)/predicted nucleotidyltransferase
MAAAPVAIADVRDLLASRHEVIAAYLFGSAAKGASEPRDLDVAVLFTRPADLTELLTLQVELERAADMPVDLHDLDRLPVELQFRVVQEGAVILDRDPPVRVRREIRILNDHNDLKPYLDRLRSATRTRLAEKCAGVVDEERVADLLAAAEAYLADVRAFTEEVGRERLLVERGEQYRIAFPLQQAIQLAIDLAAHLLADRPVHQPGTLAGLFDALAEQGMIERELAQRLAEMARFRNLLVHRYADLDLARVWEIATGDLRDIDDYLGVVAAQLP